MRFTKQTYIGLALVIGFLAFALIAAKTCNAQTAGTYTIGSRTIPYTAQQDEIMRSVYGTDWQDSFLTPQLLEAAKNHFNTARDQYKAKASSYTIDREDLMTPAEKNGFKKLLDSLRQRELREQEAAAAAPRRSALS